MGKRKKAKWTIVEAKKLMASGHSSSYGGSIDEVPLPVVRFFDDKRRKRTVTAGITIFMVVGRHYHVDIREEDDLVLDRSIDLPYRDHPTWRNSFEDEDGKGMQFWEKFDLDVDAVQYIADIWKKEFSPKTHKLVVRDSEYRKQLKKLGIKTISDW